jgi:hypothetical protein
VEQRVPIQGERGGGGWKEEEESNGYSDFATCAQAREGSGCTGKRKKPKEWLGLGKGGLTHLLSIH